MSQASFDPNDPDVRRMAQAILESMNRLARFIDYGNGVPSHTPEGPRIYFEMDGPGVHIYNGSWTAL